MYILIFITSANKKEAERIAQELIKHKLAACVNIVKDIKSVFWWQARVDKADEILLIAKSTKAKFNRIVKKVKSLHSYDVPEIIALPIIAGNKGYLEWIDEAVR
jgi:periplasmic divalent cation tolerance protein